MINPFESMPGKKKHDPLESFNHFEKITESQVDQMISETEIMRQKYIDNGNEEDAKKTERILKHLRNQKSTYEK